MPFLTNFSSIIACLKGIKEGEARYECLECEDFCECKRCADLKEHPHKMKKFIVPKGCIVSKKIFSEPHI